MLMAVCYGSSQCLFNFNGKVCEFWNPWEEIYSQYADMNCIFSLGFKCVWNYCNPRGSIRPSLCLVCRSKYHIFAFVQDYKVIVYVNLNRVKVWSYESDVEILFLVMIGSGQVRRTCRAPLLVGDFTEIASALCIVVVMLVSNNVVKSIRVVVVVERQEIILSYKLTQETFVKNVSWTYKLPRRTRLRLDITSISSPQTGLNLFVLYFDQPHYVNDRSVKLIGTGI